MPTSPNATRSFYGAVRIADDDLGEHFCELTADPYRPREMKLVVHLQGDEAEAGFGSGLGQFLRVDGPGVEVETQEGVGFHIGGQGARFTARVVQVVTTAYWFNDDPAPTHTFGYSFPLTSVTHTRGFRSHDATSGLIRSRGRVEDGSGGQTFEPVEFIQATLDGVEVEIGSAFDFADGGTARYPEDTLTQVSTLSFTVHADPQAAPPLDLARGVADAVLRLLSVLERDRIRWVTEGWYATSAEDKPLRQQKTVRWTSPPRDRSRLRPSMRNQDEAMQTLIQAYDRLDPAPRATADLMCSQFEIAATAGDLETALLRWHSVVDFTCKRFETQRNVEEKPKLKRSIIETCDAMGVDLAAVVPAAELKSVRGAFGFTKLRNQFIHDGFDVFDDQPRELIDALHTARALAERMLLATLGVNAPLSYLGTTGGPH